MSGARKDAHVRLAEAQQSAGMGQNDFDDVEFLHHALAGVDRSAVTLGVQFGGLAWPVPLYINAMTGGSDRTARINRDLAVAARETGVPIASGSMSICFTDPETRPGFTVLRDENPHGFVMANLSANATPDNAARAVDLLQANALQLHVNAVQETVMPEGSRDFSAWSAAIAAIVRRVEVPVIVKEVGFGLSRRTLDTLAGLGVGIADVSGRGGTDFARIENERRGARDYAFLAGWGQSAVCSLLDGRSAGVALLASGGVRTPLDVVRALALGANAVGASGVFLHEVLEGGAEALVTRLNAWLEQVAELMAMLGARSPAELESTDLLLRGRVREFCELVGIDAAAFTRRGEPVRPHGDRVQTSDRVQTNRKEES